METLKDPKETKAIKDHNCDFCGCVIRKGHTYLKSIHKHDHHIYDWKTHKDCAEIATKLKMYDDCDEGLIQDEFIENIHREYDDILLSTVPDNEVLKFIQQLKRVNFSDKLEYVIRYHKKRNLS